MRDGIQDTHTCKGSCWSYSFAQHHKSDFISGPRTWVFLIESQKPEANQSWLVHAHSLTVDGAELLSSLIHSIIAHAALLVAFTMNSSE
jgi:hypothetical protein